MKGIPSFATFSDQAVTDALTRLVATDRGVNAELISCLISFDARRLCLALGFNSTFSYCRDHLHMAESTAYRRIEAARLARRFRVILEMIADGRITLTNLCVIGSFLTETNYSNLLAEITHKKKSDVEVMVARLRPRPDAQTMVRRVVATSARAPEVRAAEQSAPEQSAPEPTGKSPLSLTPAPPSPASRPVIAPLAPERFKLQITMSQKTHDTLRQLQNLMRHSLPSGDAALIVERALQLLLHEVLRRKCGMRKRDLPALDPEEAEIGGHARLLH